MTVTRAGDDPEAIISCTVELPNGNIHFNGAAHLGDLAKGAVVPVVGGTKAFKRAGGTVVMKSTNPAQTNLTFDIATR